MKRFWLFIILITFVFAGASFCDESINDNAGTSSAQYLKIGIGGRPAALGDSYAALSDDTFGIFWNPAGVNRIRSLDAGFMYNSWLAQISQEVFSISVPFSLFKEPDKALQVDSYGDVIESTATLVFRPHSTISFGAVFVNMPPIQGSDIYGNYTNSYDAYSMLLLLSYSSRLIRDGLSWGVTGKYVKEQIESESAAGECFDLGLAYTSDDERLLLGLVLQNMFGEMKFVRESFSFPRNVKAGAGYWALEEKLLLVSDINKAVDENFKYSFGLEGCPYKDITLRSGWQSVNAATFGFGVKYESAFFDYAYAPYENIGGTHRISARITFDANLGMALKRKPKAKVEEVGFLIHDRGTIIGNVSDKDNNPLKDMIVKISKDDREIERLKTKEDGFYKTTELPVGTYEVKVWGEEYEAEYKNVKIENKTGFVANFKLLPPKNENYIIGMIVDANGQALKDIVVKVSIKKQEVTRLITDRDGTYKTPDLPYGVYEIKIWKQDEDKAIIKKCSVRRGKPTQLDITFE
ncbi:MAG: carboxypeptidase regulatory-like domain-containing protein [Elusimicrobia bacterium]|nr:carboxypeptidase regulatory-like domain-containing protein [Candidatus Liberimonas magnetica]